MVKGVVCSKFQSNISLVESNNLIKNKLYVIFINLATDHISYTGILVYVNTEVHLSLFRVTGVLELTPVVIKQEPGINP